MRLVTLFNGAPAPLAPRPYVAGFDSFRLSDTPEYERWSRELHAIAALCALPNTPFTGRLRFRAE